MAQYSNGTVQDEHATDSEVEAAIRALTPPQTQRLIRFAKYKATGLAGLGVGINAEDLLQEAVLRTLWGKRKWRKEAVTIEKHLIGAIRSIANHARDEFNSLDGRPIAQNIDVGNSGSGSTIAPLVSRLPDSERISAAHQKLEQIEQRFLGDEEVLLVIEGLSTEMNGPEIQRELSITQTQYETIMTRLRRGIDRKEGWEP